MPALPEHWRRHLGLLGGPWEWHVAWLGFLVSETLAWSDSYTCSSILMGALLVRKPLEIRMSTKVSFASLVRKPSNLKRRIRVSLTGKAPTIIGTG